MAVTVKERMKPEVRKREEQVEGPFIARVPVRTHEANTTIPGGDYPDSEMREDAFTRNQAPDATQS